MENHVKKLEGIKEKKKALQEEESKIKEELTREISEFLIDSGTFDHIEFDIVLGGILDVIDQAQKDDKQSEVWKVSGKKFRQQNQKIRNRKNNEATK